MPLFLWGEALSVNVHEIDDQHRRLLDLLNAMQTALQEAAPRERLMVLLDEFARTTIQNFETEERLMLLHDVPDFVAHKVRHDRFLAEFNLSREHLDAERIHLSLSLLEGLADWWKNHIVDFDAKCGAWLNRKGVA